MLRDSENMYSLPMVTHGHLNRQGTAHKEN
jgi:hypothetical protein